MNYRHAVILPETDLGSTSTEVIDDFGVDPISRFTIAFRPVGGSNSPVKHPAASISKIELVDGSDVLFSLTGYQAQAINIMRAEKPHPQVVHFFTGGTPQVPFHIDFGRYLWDEQLAFDPQKFKNPQLKITHDETAWDASCSSHGLSVHAHMFDQKKIMPMGFLMKKEIKAYTPSSGANEYTNLPTDFPHRALFIQGFCAGGGLRAIVREVRLDEDNDKRVLIDGDVDLLRNYLDEFWGDAVDVIVGTVAAGSVTFFCTPHNHSSVAGITDTDAKTIAGKDLSGGQFWATGEAAGLANFTVRGKNPHGVMGIPFGRQELIDDWYDVSQIGKLRLRIIGGPNSSSSYTNRIVCEQLRRY
ncbi:hypothetical protein LCGC14_1164320 [marine sediment metagenome]|uniref:Uncharacterized protein n=1 Tax=marine sediment metagenome TaxID=412755 RepID=A0A0F9LRR9_9ZZZZ